MFWGVRSFQVFGLNLIYVCGIVGAQKVCIASIRNPIFPLLFKKKDILDFFT
jgi:hypothetical protein